MLLFGEISFSFKVSLSELRPWFFLWDVAYLSLKTSIELFFFPFLFSVYCGSVVFRVVSSISGDWNQSFSTLLCVVFKLLYWCLSTLFNTCKSSFSFFFDTYSLSTSSLGCNVLCTVINFFVLWSNCFSFSLVPFMNGPEYLMRGTVQVFIPLIRFLLYSFISSIIIIMLKLFTPMLANGLSQEFEW